VKLRKEFVLKALAQDVPFRKLCREFGISRKTGYTWLERFHERGLEGLVDQSTRPQSSPGRTTSEIAVPPGEGECAPHCSERTEP